MYPFFVDPPDTKGFVSLFLFFSLCDDDRWEGKSLREKRMMLMNEIEKRQWLDDWKIALPITISAIHDDAVSLLKEYLWKQIRSLPIDRRIAEELKTQLQQQIIRGTIAPSESVGIICAQSIGERQTQSTLNSFHSCGLGIQLVTTGVPRFMELLNATKEPKMSSCEFRCHGSFESLSDLREHLGTKVVYLTLRKLSTKYTFFYEKSEEPWYSAFFQQYAAPPTCYTHGISFQLEKEMLYRYRVPLFRIQQCLVYAFPEIFVVFSPMHFGQIDVFVDTQCVVSSTTDTTMSSSSPHLLYLEEIVLPRLFDYPLCGIKGISQLFFEKQTDQSILCRTEGSNLQGLLRLPEIDRRTLRCNHMWQIYEVFGIEAARQFLMDEFMFVMGKDDYIHSCHVTLLVDIMTFHGTIISVSRYGIKKESSGPLSKASFEECLDHFLNAGFCGTVEKLRGVSASIICGKRPLVGTGAVDILLDTKCLESMGHAASSSSPSDSSSKTDVPPPKEVVVLQETIFERERPTHDR